MAKRVLIVGAGGFIGGFMAEQSLKRGYETWVTVRESTSRRFLGDERLNFLVLDYDDTQAMTQVLTTALPENERWDYIVYNLGATKCANFLDFNRINYQYLRNFCDILCGNNLVPERFLYMSSLSALGPGDEKNYEPLKSSMFPCPNTRYGLSKVKAEMHLQMIENFPYIIFRPTGVYGPHEQDYLLMIKSIDRHWDFGVGFRRQMLTFIYVEDLVNAVYDALESGVVQKKYIISEERAYSQKEFRTIVAQELGGRWVIPVKLPLFITYIASYFAEKWGMAKMQPSTLNRDKFKIMKQRNWSCDVSDAQRDFGFKTRFSLRDGIKATVAAYLKEKESKQNK